MIENISLAFKGGEELGLVIGNLKAQDIVEGKVRYQIFVLSSHSHISSLMVYLVYCGNL